MTTAVATVVRDDSLSDEAEIIRGVNFGEKIDADHLAWIAALKAAATTAVPKLGRVNPYAITIVPEWNRRRMDLQENIDHVDALALTMLPIGHNGKPTGVLTPIGYVMIGKEIIALSGHSRRLGVFRAIEVYGAKIADVPVAKLPIITEGKSRKQILRECLFMQEVMNKQKSFCPLESGELFAAMMRDVDEDGEPCVPMTLKQIAAINGMSSARVSQCIGYFEKIGGSPQIMEMISLGRISVSHAADIIDGNDGDVEAAEMVIAAAHELAKKDALEKRKDENEPLSFKIMPKDVLKLFPVQAASEVVEYVASEVVEYVAEPSSGKDVSSTTENTSQAPSEAEATTKGAEGNTSAPRDTKAAGDKPSTKTSKPSASSSAQEQAEEVANLLDMKWKALTNSDIFSVTEIQIMKQWMNYTLLGAAK